jgi:hypothetical protein
LTTPQNGGRTKLAANYCCCRLICKERACVYYTKGETVQTASRMFHPSYTAQSLGVSTQKVKMFVQLVGNQIAQI